MCMTSISCRVSECQSDDLHHDHTESNKSPNTFSCLSRQSYHDGDNSIYEPANLFRVKSNFNTNQYILKNTNCPYVIYTFTFVSGGDYLHSERRGEYVALDRHVVQHSNIYEHLRTYEKLPIM